MVEIERGGLRVRLGRPRPVSEGVGFHWFPSLAKLPSGELLLSRLLVADTNEELDNTNAITLSSDGGATWERSFDVAGFIGGCAVRITTQDGALAAPSYYLYPEPPGQYRSFAGHYERYEQGGRRYVLEPWGVRVEGLPRDVAMSPYDGKWGRRWMAQFNFWGDAVDLGGEVVTIAYLRYAGETQYSTVCLASSDEGRTWRYRAKIADPGDAPWGREGSNESSLVLLPDGDLLGVLRVGGGSDQFLARTYGADGGRSWSAPEPLPAFSVAPCLRRLTNGVLALSTGRPGISLWLSDDPRGRSWHTLDLLAHHNALMGEQHQIRPGKGGKHPDDPYQTTAYTVMVETAPNRILLTYDRIPFGWHGVPKDSNERSRIYVMTIEVERR